jgi:predicted RNase H-like HicB family nuclease
VKTIVVEIDYDPNTKTYGATSPDLPDIYAISSSRDDVLARFEYSANEYIKYLREEAKPPPFSDSHHEIVTIEISAT